MKKILLALLFCLLLETILSTKTTTKMKITKAIKDIKVKHLRKEENTDQATDAEYDGDNYDPPEDDYNPNQYPEMINITAENMVINSSIPVSLKYKITGNTSANVQFIKFHGFNASNGPGKANFNIYFYFLGKTIPKKIIMRLRITYDKGLSPLAESAITDCEIVNTSLSGTFASEEEGKIVNYLCEVNATQGNASDATYNLNSDIYMMIEHENGTNETLDFSELNFNGNSVSESINIQENIVELNGDEFSLKEAVASVDKYILKFTGNFVNYTRRLRRLDIMENFTLAMNFPQVDNNTAKTYICSLNITNNITPIADQIICNTSGNPIKTTTSKLHLSSGISSNGQFVIIKMKDFNSTIISTEYNEYLNSTSIISTEYNDYDDETDIEYIPPHEEYFNVNSSSTQAENISVTIKDYKVNSTKPVSQKGYKADNKKANIHVMKFHSFSKAQGKINFNNIFYFIGKVIPYGIIYRSRITYNFKLKNLQTEEAESVRTDCQINNESLAGTIQSNGINVDYICSANASKNTSDYKVQLNTDVNMILVSKNGVIEENLDFNKVSFNGNTSEEAKHIQENTNIIKTQAYLKNTTAYIEKCSLKFFGTYEEKSLSSFRRLAFSNGQIIPINLKTKVNNQNVTIKYNCIFNHLSNNNAELECDTSENPINTNVENLHLSNGISDDGTFLTIEMFNWQTNGSTVVSNSESCNTLILKEAIASAEKYILKLIGNLVNYREVLRRPDIFENNSITMNFSDIDDNKKTYNCLLNISKNITPIEDQIICNTSGNPIKTNPIKLHKSSGISSKGDIIIIQMKDFNSTSIISTEYNEVFNSTIIISTEYNDIIENNNYNPPPAEDYKDNISSTQAENINATAKDSPVNSSKPISQKGYKSDNKSSNIQIMKFHSFSTSEEAGKINFNTIFYFIAKVIPYGIIYRSRITYNSKLRNLQTGKEAESVRTDCNITNESLAGTIQPNGINVNYKCSANASKIESISNIQLNTDVNMSFVNKNGTIEESLDFNEISFNGNASEEAKNIQENDEKIKTQAYLKNTTATIEKYNITFTGTYKEESLSRLRRLGLSNGQIIPMKLMTKVNNINDTITYNCTFNHLTNNNTEIECDTSKCPINTNIQNLHLSNGISDGGTFLTIEMLNWETEGNKSLVATTYSSNTRSKISSGLSGGAIAGIVIACVVVLLAVIFSIIYLRKSEPPLNNTVALDKKYDSSIKVFA